MRPFKIFLLLALCTCLLAGAQEKQRATKPEARESQSVSAPAHTGMSKEQVQALQADIKRMQILVHQMQNNLAAVTSAQDPLKHQFELEIEMWQILINQMERTVQGVSTQ